MQTFLSFGGCLKLKLPIPSPQYETPQFYGPKYVVSFLTSTMVSGGWFWFQLSVDRCLQKAAEKSSVLIMQIKLIRSMFLESNPGTEGQCVSCNVNGSLDLEVVWTLSGVIAAKARGSNSWIICSARGTTTKQILQNWDDSVENPSRIILFTLNKNEPILSTVTQTWMENPSFRSKFSQSFPYHRYRYRYRYRSRYRY